MNYKIRSVVFLILLTLIIISCTSTPSTANSEISPTNTLASVTVTPTRVMQTGIWDELLQVTPIPQEYPLPESVQSALDGTYATVNQNLPQFWTCYRCADYRPTGGIWRLQFDKGVMRIFYQITNWKSIASFTVEGNRLKLFNDPFCLQTVGEYEWVIKNGNLSLTAIADDCAFGLRKENLTTQTWEVCEINGNQAEGCNEPPESPEGQTPSELSVTVTVHGGDSHYFDSPPDVFVAANDQNVPSPEGIQIRYHDKTIPYGTHRILWWQGDWIEATTELPFTSIGVQLWGSGYLGWARVLFDGEEVWRGLTTSLGRHHAYYGGYVEITGFEPGLHTIRVENLGFDYRPIKVYKFGFSNQTIEK